MPPHCDSLDGPVVKAAGRALAERNVDLVLPFVHEDGEQEVRDRAREGAPYTGLKPAGLGHGPVVPVAERAIETGSPDELVALLTGMVEEEIRGRFERLMQLKMQANGDLGANRAYVESMLGLEVWSHSIYQALHAGPHEAHQHEHAHS
jgi:hypothetical protein